MMGIADQPCYQAAIRSVESSLVDDFRRGDPNAFEQIVALYSKQVHTLASRLLAWPDEAEDVVQDVFTKALLHRKRFRGDCSLKTWLFTITVNTCRSQQVRQKLWRKFFSKQTAERRRKSEVRQTDYEPVRKAVAALPVKYRQVIVLKYLNECSTRDMMEILNITESTLNTRLSRGRQLLKESLKNWTKKNA